MRVLDITGFFTRGAGGIKTYYQAKARFLPPLGFDCHFVVPSEKSDEQPFGDATLHGVAGPPMPLDPNYRLMTDLGRLRALVQRLSPDVVEIASHYVLPELVGWAAAPKRPAVVGFYHSDVPGAYVAPFVPRPLARLATDAAFGWVRRRHRRYRRTLVASRCVEDELVGRGVPDVVRVGLGVDLERFRPEPTLRSREPTVLFAGRLCGEKSIPLLLDAWAGMPDPLGATLLVAGSGPLAARVGGRRVRFLGYIGDREELARLLATAWVVVVPGAYETFSLTTAEALASGTPVLTADCGASAELAGASGGGRTFAARDGIALRRALVSLLSLSPEARDEMGARGREHVAKDLSWPAVCGRIATVYRQLA